MTSFPMHSRLQRFIRTGRFLRAAEMMACVLRHDLQPPRVRKVSFGRSPPEAQAPEISGEYRSIGWSDDGQCQQPFDVPLRFGRCSVLRCDLGRGDGAPADGSPRAGTWPLTPVQSSREVPGSIRRPVWNPLCEVPPARDREGSWTGHG